MTPDEFQAGVDRLKNQFPSSYGDERVKVIYRAVKRELGAVWMDAVSDLLASQRMAPMLPEIERALDEAASRHRAASNATPLSVLQNASQKTSASPELIKFCLEALRYKQEKKPSSEEWEAIMSQMDNFAKQLRMGKSTSCARCDGSGIVFLKGEYDSIARCFCEAGDAQPSELKWKHFSKRFPKITEIPIKQ